MLCAYWSSVLPNCRNYTYSWLANPSLWRACLIGATEARPSALLSSGNEIADVAHKIKEHYSCITVMREKMGEQLCLICIVCVKIVWVNILVGRLLSELLLKVRTFGLIMPEDFRNWDWSRKSENAEHSDHSLKWLPQLDIATSFLKSLNCEFELPDV